MPHSGVSLGPSCPRHGLRSPVNRSDDRAGWRRRSQPATGIGVGGGNEPLTSRQRRRRIEQRPIPLFADHNHQDRDDLSRPEQTIAVEAGGQVVEEAPDVVLGRVLMIYLAWLSSAPSRPTAAFRWRSAAIT